MKKLLIVLSILLVNAAVYVLWYLPISFEKEDIRIAVVGPMSSPSGEAMRKGVELYRDQINSQGGINGRPVELLFFDDNNDPETAERIASEIAAENKVLLVLGHYGSPASIAAGVIYKRNEIPAITASATAISVIKGNDWYFRIVPDNALEAQFVANYIGKSMKKRFVSIIYINNEYGISLAENFEKAVSSLGMRLEGKWEWDEDKPQDEQLERIVAELTATEDPGAIYFATPDDVGVRILTELIHSGKSYPVIGYAFGIGFLSELKPYAMEWSNPGYYSEGVYYVTPFMIDMGGSSAFAFQEAFHAKYDEEPRAISSCYYDAAHVAVQAIKKNPVQGEKKIRETRRTIRETLEGFYKEENAVTGITGDIWFDDDGGIVRHYAVGVWRKQKPMPAFSQYRQYDGEVENMMQAVLEGGIILAKSTVMRHTRVVYAETEIIGISNVDPKRSQFTAEFNLVFRFPGDFDDANIEFTNAAVPVVLGDPVSEETQAGITTRKYHVKARFRTAFDFRHHPFDRRHILTISFRHKDRTNEELIYAPAVYRKALDIHDAGWHLTNMFSYQDVMSKQTTLGNPEFFNSKNILTFSRFDTEIWVEEKNALQFIGTKLIPMFFLVMILYASYFVPPERLQHRLLMVMITFSAGVAFHLKQLASLPVRYLTLMDYVCFILYLLVIVSFFIAMSAHRFSMQGNEKKGKTLARAVRIAYPCVLLVIAFIFEILVE